MGLEREKITTKARGKKKKKADTEMSRHKQQLEQFHKRGKPWWRAYCWKVWIFLVLKEARYCKFLYVIWPASKTLDLPPTHPPFEGAVFTHLVLFSLVRQMLRFERLTGLAMLLLTSDIHREHSALLQIEFDLIKWRKK